MMTVAGFLRGLLLLTTATTFMLMQPAVADSTSSTALEACPAETEACGVDETCVNCSVIVDETSSSLFDACGEGVTADGLDSSTAFCTGAMAGICCLDEASDFDCVDNDEFVDLWLCVLESRGCSFDDITCDEDGGPVGSPGSSGATAVVGHASMANVACALFVAAFLPLMSV